MPCKPQRLKRIKPVHRKVMRMLIAGHTRIDIAEKLNFTPNSISRMGRDPLFSAEFAKMEARRQKIENATNEQMIMMAKNRLGELSLQAADTVGDLMNSDNEHIQMRASEAVLDRTLPRKVEEGPQGAFGMRIDDSTVNLFLGVLEESKRIEVQSRVVLAAPEIIIQPAVEQVLEGASA